ncbi:preprotein translocase subunit SecG [Azospira sp. I13]|jgi:preprotein translocase subunit SecG|uniref:preprotein translocase subunit SecG n=1 Tax=Azospira sp. I13 TaxID=1765050 RepID=UPI000D496A94|nr:preprotein translocase subunit SecG [Azospira sp. I13]GBG01212.1 preprotein translocase subunit SecG [Azospira sp. I13]
MNYLFSVVLVVHILAALGIIGLVLIQHGKGADMGAAFGSGASGSLFGATGSANFLSRATALLAIVFFSTSLALAYLASAKPKSSGSVMQDAVQSAPASAPNGAPAVAGGDASPAPADAGVGSKAKDIPK